ncbi:MAG: GtrA family protein [Calditrichia bacterium]
MFLEQINAVFIKFLNKRFAKFAAVGGSGVVVNMLVIYLFTEFGQFHYTVSSLFAIELSILFNFTLNNAWTWADRKETPLFERLRNYHIAAGLTAFIGNWGMLILLSEFFGLNYLVSNLFGIATGALLNYYLNDMWTFRAAQSVEKENA